MNGTVPFDPQKEAHLLSAYVDGELEPGDVARIEAYLEENPAARREVEQLQRLKQLTGAMRLKEAPAEEWEVFWESVYNRAERSLGWILFVLAAAVLGGWAVWELATVLLETEQLPWIVKGAIVVGTGGVLVLLLSVIRERVFKRSRTRYKDVIR